MPSYIVTNMDAIIMNDEISDAIDDVLRRVEEKIEREKMELLKIKINKILSRLKQAEVDSYV